MDTKSFFVELENGKGNTSTETLLLEPNKKKQHNGGSRELKRLHSSINYKGHSKRNKEGGVDIQISK